MAICLLFVSGCGAEEQQDPYVQKRHAMVAEQIEVRGVQDERVLEAMRAVPRHLFVPVLQRPFAYEDRPLPIGHKQTISQPYIVALMTEMAGVDEGDVVLEVGTGSGYQAAVLSVMAKEVYSIEYLEPLGLEAKKRLQDLGYDNVSVKIGDGYKGWPEHKPFDAIIVTAGIDHVPPALVEQLNKGGRMVIPVGPEGAQELLLLTKDEQGKMLEHKIIPVRFVPFLGLKE